MTPAKKPTKAKATDAPQAAQAPTGVVMIKGKAVPMRGRTFIGVVTSDRMAKTVTVEWERRRYVPKYQRYEKRRTSVKAHDETGAKIGDTVEIRETRPLSKTKHFLVVRKIEKKN